MKPQPVESLTGAALMVIWEGYLRHRKRFYARSVSVKLLQDERIRLSGMFQAASELSFILMQADGQGVRWWAGFIIEQT